MSMPAGRAAIAAAALLAAALPARGDPLTEACATGAREGIVVLCEQALAAHPDDNEVRRDLAHATYVAGNYQRAIGIYLELTARQPDEARAWADHAGALGSLRHYGEAALSMDRAVRIAPGDLGINQLAAIIYRAAGRLDEALAAERRAALLGDEMAMFELAQMYKYGVGVEVDPDAAFSWLRRAAEAGHGFAMTQMAEIYLDGQYGQPVDTDRAFEWAERARRIRNGE